MHRHRGPAGTDALREQDALPGGRVGRAAPGNEAGTRTWQAANTNGHRTDPKLQHTTVRWSSPDNRELEGWYVLTNDGPHGQCIARTGPFKSETAKQLERVIERLSGAEPGAGTDEKCIETISEALYVRLAGTASRLTLTLGSERERRVLAGQRVAAQHHSDELLRLWRRDEGTRIRQAIEELKHAVRTLDEWELT